MARDPEGGPTRPPDARAAAETAARTSYGRLLAILTARGCDLASAEDALADAFAAALAHWPTRGVPRVPDAWLLTAARRVQGRRARHAGVQSQALPDLAMLAEGRAAPAFVDRRLALMLLCAHPAIDPAIHTPLMLQAVLGLDAARIAQAFLVAPATMAQRLVRAKAKIRAARIPFADPDPADLADRLGAVLAAIYAAFGADWDGAVGGEPVGGEGLTDEAIHLARLVVALAPDEPEPRGLLALMLFCAARTRARRDAAGGFVPLGDQDWRLWSQPHIAEAEGALRAAAALARPGRFQTEAAIQSLHVQVAVSGTPQREALVLLYDALALQAPTLGVLVARAAAHGAAAPDRGLALLDALEPTAADYQPYWATRAHLLSRSGQPARAVYDRAVHLTRDPALRGFLAIRRDAAM